MPKEQRARAYSFDRSRASPFFYPSKNTEDYDSKNSLGSNEDVKQWEEARCPVCMEHPHNAVLLLCSSHEKGCRPYMCNTSYRHSNCLDRYCKSTAATPSTFLAEQANLSSTTYQHRREEFPFPIEETPLGNQLPSVACPLCRGQLSGWVAIDPARKYMNSKTRSCSSETCSFSGNYTELRKHARLRHPSVRPADVDPTRERDWRRLERERDYRDILSMTELGLEDELDRDDIFSLDILDLFMEFVSVIDTQLMFSLFDSDSSPSPRADFHNRISTSPRWGGERSIYHTPSSSERGWPRQLFDSDSSPRPRTDLHNRISASPQRGGERSIYHTPSSNERGWPTQNLRNRRSVSSQREGVRSSYPNTSLREWGWSPQYLHNRRSASPWRGGVRSSYHNPSSGERGWPTQQHWPNQRRSSRS